MKKNQEDCLGEKKMGKVEPKGVSPDLWGNHTWRMLHGIACLVRSDPTREKTELVYVLLHTLPVLLPCAMCRTNLKAHMHARPIPTRCGTEALSAEALQAWIHEIHNAVNILVGKPIVQPRDGMDGEFRAMSHAQRLERVVCSWRAATVYMRICVDERRRFTDPACGVINDAWAMYVACVPKLLRLVEGGEKKSGGRAWK